VTIEVPDGENVSIGNGRAIVGDKHIIIEKGSITIDSCNSKFNLLVEGDVTVNGGVGGKVIAKGNVKCGSIAGKVEAEGDVNCTNISGKVEAGGSVNAKTILGSVKHFGKGR